MILVFSPKGVVPRVIPEIVGYFNQEVVKEVPKFLPTNSPSHSESIEQNKIEKSTSHLRSVAQNTTIHPQDSESDGQQPPPKTFFRPRENMKDFNQFPDEEE
ncbi:hypothetical protein O181_012963 [Austropuccinia psidii MF-1]|uniref:Uncharacterized protein n=1 Tax=Austropuccinia psidii MF-1 TaxID=1389203 RepID=A0A9Q3BYB8_9BASI|nr:hypothetical protein [Austropuccinia psidii MF-1]